MGGLTKQEREAKAIIEQKLIEHVKLRPHIYDKQNEGHRDVLKISNSWKKICEEIDDEKFASSADKCEKLWKSLWAQYLAHKRNIAGKTGNAGGKRPYFRHENSMREFDDKIFEEETFSNVPRDSDSVTDDQTESGTRTVVVDLVVNNEELLEIVTSEGSTTNDKLPPGTSKQSLVSTPLTRDSSYRSHDNKKKRIANKSEFEEEMIELLKSQKEMDEHELFGANIAVKMRKISQMDPKVSTELQFNIYELLFIAEKSLI